MPCRLYLDEDTSATNLLLALRSRKVDVVTTLDAGFKEASDEAQLEWAEVNGRVIYTFNAQDFCALHAAFLRAGRGHAGIIVGEQQRFSVGEQLRLLLRIVQSCEPAEMINRIEFLSNWR